MLHLVRYRIAPTQGVRAKTKGYTVYERRQEEALAQLLAPCPPVNLKAFGVHVKFKGPSQHKKICHIINLVYQSAS